MANNNTPLLAAFGMSMGFSADDMHDIVVDMHASLPDNDTVSPLEDVSDATKGMDKKTLWIGAMLYGYILDAYEDIDVSEAINQMGDEQ